jgi:hypothetical protein
LSLPEPELGLVIRYAYLWQSEHAEGREEGIKDRPCAVVLLVRSSETSRKRLTVLPIMHAPPRDPATAVEIPANVKRHLGLDHERSWIVLNEGNEFYWPGPDLRPQPGGDFSTVAYGFLPSGMYDVILERFLAFAKQNRHTKVPRTE